MARQIAHLFARQRFSRWFARPIALRMVANSAYFRSSTAFTPVFTPYCRADGSGLLILLLVNGFPVGSCAVLLCGWQRIAHTSARQWLSGRFTRRMAQPMASDCLYLRSSTAFTTVCAPYCSADASRLLKPPLFNGFPNGSSAVSLSG